MCLIPGRLLTLVLLSLVTVEARIIFNKQSKLFKVQIFSEGHKILKNLPIFFDIITAKYIVIAIYFSNFVAFTEYLNFN